MQVLNKQNIHVCYDKYTDNQKQTITHQESVPARSSWDVGTLDTWAQLTCSGAKSPYIVQKIVPFHFLHNLERFLKKLSNICIALAFLFDGSCVYFRFLSNLKRLRFISMCSLGRATSDHKSWLHSNKCKTLHFAKIPFYKSISFPLSFLSSTSILAFWENP